MCSNSDDLKKNNKDINIKSKHKTQANEALKTLFVKSQDIKLTIDKLEKNLDFILLPKNKTVTNQPSDDFPLIPFAKLLEELNRNFSCQKSRLKCIVDRLDFYAIRKVTEEEG